MAAALAVNMSEPRPCTDTLLQAGSALQALLEVQPPPTCAPTAVFLAPYIPAISALPLATLLALLHACDLAALPAAITDSVTACLAQRYASQPVPAFQAEVATPSPRAAALVHAWWGARFGAQQGALAGTHPEARHWRAHLASPTAWAASHLPFYPALPVLPPIAFGLQAQPPAEELWVRGLSAPGQPPPPHPHTAALLALTFGASHWAHAALPPAPAQHTAAVLALARAADAPAEREHCAASLATLLASSTENAALTQLCCAALWRLALQPEWCSSSPAAPSVLGALLGALAAHPHHSGIAAAGCAAAGHLLRTGLAQAEVAAALLPGLPTLTAALCSPALAPEATEAAAACFRRMLSSEAAPPTAAVRACPGALPRLVQLLQWRERPAAQLEAAWALTNMASGCAEDTAAVAAAGALPPLVALLDSPEADVLEQAIWALGNMAGDSLPLREAVLAAGAIPPLLRAITPATRLATLRTAAWAMSNLARCCKAGESVDGVTQPPLAALRPLLPRLAALVSSCRDAEVLSEALWALSHLSEGGTENQAAVLEAGCTQSLVALLGHDSPKVQTPALRVLGNLLSGEDALAVRAVLNAGALPALAALLGAPGSSAALAKEACWALSNACDSAGHIAAVLQCPGLLPQLLAHARAPHPLGTAREACWALRNAVAGGSAEAVAGLVAGGALEALVGLLQGEGQQGYSDLLAVAMEAVAGMVQKQGVSAQRAAAAGLPLALMQLTQRLPSWHEASRLAGQVLLQHFPQGQLGQLGQLGGLGGGFAAEMLEALPQAPY